MKGKTGMLPLDEVLPKRGWMLEPTQGFQTSEGQEPRQTKCCWCDQFQVLLIFRAPVESGMWAYLFFEILVQGPYANVAAERSWK